jgi:transcriptional/translational regulatory protein YebC/TACO1
MVLLPVWNHQKELENRNLEILSSGFERIPQITKKLTEAEMADVEKLIEKWKKMMT